MLTRISPKFQDRAASKVAESIIRKCVHCGFCTATCPTYQLLGDERDSPRGRIYIIKSLLEGNDVTEQSRTHLDRCLTCRACETVCPSGVEYGRLLEVGRQAMHEQLPARSMQQRLFRLLLTSLLPYRQRFSLILALGRLATPLLPKTLRAKIPDRQTVSPVTQSAANRKVILVQGCVQGSLTPSTNAATQRLLARLGIECITVKQEGCCGALSQHLDAEHQARSFMKNNIDAWMPYVEQGVEAIISTASGCGVFIKDYQQYFHADETYRDKARAVSGLCRDISEFINEQDLQAFEIMSKKRIAFQCPCTLQHGQKLTGLTEKLLTRLGFQLMPVDEAHLCCGSAGTYSLLQPQLSASLRQRKLSNLMRHRPEMIVTANIGCQMHLQEAADVPVRHWIEVLEEEISSKTQSQSG